MSLEKTLRRGLSTLLTSADCADVLIATFGTKGRKLTDTQSVTKHTTYIQHTKHSKTHKKKRDNFWVVRR